MNLGRRRSEWRPRIIWGEETELRLRLTFLSDRIEFAHCLFLFFFMAQSEGKRIQPKPGGVDGGIDYGGNDDVVGDVDIVPAHQRNQLDPCCEKGN